MGKNAYVINIDNLLKILSILLRLEYQLPAILMGETGCGKTALVEFICDSLEVPLMKLDLHGGITDADITKFIRKCIARAREERITGKGYLVAFLDEINAANCLAYCKSLICDRLFEGERLPDNVRIVACCNPYRLRTLRGHSDDGFDSGLVYQHHFADGGIGGNTDLMKKLVYRVYQLPEALMDLVADFGALTDISEKQYIKAILHRELAMAVVSSFIAFSYLLLGFHSPPRDVSKNEKSNCFCDV